jgi:hypothetical protein
MSTTFGPNYAANAQYINAITTGSTILAQNLNSVLGDLNLSGYSMGVSLGNWASFGAPFSQDSTLIGNIIIGYSSAISLITGQTASLDVGSIIYQYKNLGGF